MPYYRSRARKQFDIDTTGLLNTVREAFSKKCSSPSVREFALCSAVLLCSARLESYLEDLLADWSQSVRTHGLTTDKLNKRTRAFLLNRSEVAAAYRRFVCYGDESELLTRLEALIETTHYDFGINDRPIPSFPAQAIYRDRKYPSAKNLQALFSRFGFPNIFHQLSSIASRDTKALLTSFNDLRGEMAHMGMPPGLTSGDIRHHVMNVRSLVGYIDRVFYSHVAKSIGSRCWTV
jgi:hypothetical protein